VASENKVSFLRYNFVALVAFYALDNMKQTIEFTSKLRPFFSITCALILLLAVGFANPPEKKLSNAEISTSLDDLGKDITDLKTKLNTLTRVVNEHTTKLKSPEGNQQMTGISQAIEPLRQSVAGLENRINTLAAEQAQMQKRLLAAEQRAHYSDSINFEILSQLVILENRLVSLGNSINEYNAVTQTGPPGPDRSVPGVGSAYKDRYLIALSLHQNGKFEEAIELFRKLIVDDRTNSLADNAQYWIGESYYSMKQYQRAVIEFEKVSAFSNSDKGDDAQYKIGLCYKQVGNQEKSRAEFQKLIELYPQSEFAENAKQLIR
jgi:TolA-binding protein